jgi:proteasome lid subunit RPN8/RPN11
MNTISEIKREQQLRGSQFIVKWSGKPLPSRRVVDNSDAVREIWKEFVASQEGFDSSKEAMVMIAVNARYHFCGWHHVATGNARAILVDPRDVLRAALMIDAQSVVIVHNHPSGQTSPSKSDLKWTEALLAACEIVGVGLFDHVVVDSEGSDACSIRGAYPTIFGDKMPGRGIDCPIPAMAENERPVLTTCGKAGVEIMITLPAAAVGKHSKSLIQAAVFETVTGFPAKEWVSRWNNGTSLKEHVRRSRSLESLPFQIILTREDYAAIEDASAQIQQSAGSLLAALACGIIETLDVFAKVEAARKRKPTNVLEFRS